jgi:hypothetical protein
VTPCVRNHAIPRVHVSPCTCTLDCPAHDDHCPGCALFEASFGLLCGGDARRLLDHLGASEDPRDEHAPHGLPWAWEHLGQFVEPSPHPGAVGGSGELQVPISLAVVDLRNEIRDWLGTTTADLMERLDRVGPVGVTLTTDYRERHIGVDWHIVRRCAAWLLAQGESLAAGAGIPDEDVAAEAVRGVWQGAADLMSRAHALAPWRPAPTHIDGVPCRCGELSLHHHGDVIKCWNGACGVTYTREQYETLTVVLARRFARETQDA